MKAHFRSNSCDRAQIVEFEPESDDDRERLREFGAYLQNPNMISHRGFTYMSPVVSVYIQPMPGED